MVRFRFLSGTNAGKTEVLQRSGFPLIIGRSSSADVRIEEKGVWDKHADVRMDLLDGFEIHSHSDALVYVNGDLVRETRLKVGDVIEIGSCRLEFLLDQTRLKDSTMREALTWAFTAGVLVLQTLLISWLVR